MKNTKKIKTKPQIEIDLKQVESLASKGLTKEQIANSLGISYSTLNRRHKDLEDLEDAIKRGRSKGIAVIASKLFDKANSGDTTSMIFYLKTQAGWKESQIIEQESNLNVTINKPLSELFEDEST